MTTKKTKTAKQLATQLATLCHEEQMTLLGFAEGLSPEGQELALAMVRELVAAEEQAAKVVADKPRAPRRAKAVRLSEERERFLTFARSPPSLQEGTMGDYLSRGVAREGAQSQARWDWAPLSLIEETHMKQKEKYHYVPTAPVLAEIRAHLHQSFGPEGQGWVDVSALARELSRGHVTVRQALRHFVSDGTLVPLGGPTGEIRGLYRIAQA